MLVPPKVILAPVDFSEVSGAAKDVAADLAKRLGSMLCLVHVVPMLPKLPASVSIFKEGDYERELHRDAEERLGKMVEELSAKGVRVESAVGTSNDVPMEIIRLAESQSADLIVISTHGATGWNRLAFGSVAEKVLHLAFLPVLVLRANVESKSQDSQTKAESIAATD